MAELIRSTSLYSEQALFSQGIKAGEFTFLAQDARRSGNSIKIGANGKNQASKTLENLGIALGSVGLELADLVSLTVFLTDYDDAPSVAKVIESAFPHPTESFPAVAFLGVMGLEGGCQVRMDAVATSNPDREQMVTSHVPLPLGARCHGVQVGNLVFLSGMDAADTQRRPTQPVSIENQTLVVIDRIDSVLKSQKLQLANVFRTFMFMTDTKNRPGYRETRRKRYQNIFREDEFPANSGIYIKDLGKDILLKPVAIAFSGKDKALISSPKVWLAPGSFSQAFQVGKWLFVSGQDAIREVPRPTSEVDVLSPDVRRSSAYETEAIGDLAGQTKVSLNHIKYIVEEAAGTMDDVVKTTVYLVAGQDRATFAAAYRDFLKFTRKDSTMPAGLTVEVKELAPSCLVEIDAVALLEK